MKIKTHERFRNPVDEEQLPIIRIDQFYQVYRNYRVQLMQYYKHSFAFTLEDETNQLNYRIQVNFPGGDGLYKYLAEPHMTVFDVFQNVEEVQDVAQEEIAIAYKWSYDTDNKQGIAIARGFKDQTFVPGQPVTWYESNGRRQESGIFKSMSKHQEGMCFVVFNTLQPENWENLTAAQVRVKDLRHGWLLKGY